jgi:TP901 family phage tail tape measure protein
MADFNASANFSQLIAEISKANDVWRAYAGAQKQATTATKDFLKSNASLQSGITSTTKLFDQYNQAINNTAQRVDTTSKSVKDQSEVIKDNNKNIKEMTLSWSTFGRLAVFSIASQALSTFTNSLKESISESIKFRVELGRIQTISQENQLTTNEWAKGLKNVAGEFNLDLLDATAAAYLAISNQVANGADTFNFLAEAARLSKIAQADLTQSTNALSSVLKSYNLEVDATREISDKLFKAAELGRLPLEAISDSIGTVTVAANSLGVGIDEVLATLATLTVQGVTPANAMTFLRNVLLKVIKPTDAMKEAVAELGFSSAEAGIKSLGLINFIESLGNTTNGSVGEMAELFNSIRAIQGVLGITGKNTELFRKNLEGIGNASKSADEALKLFTATAAERLSKQLNQLKVNLEGFGDGFTKVITPVIELFGGLTNVVGIFSVAILVKAIPALAVYKTTIIAAAVATKGFLLVLGPIALAVGAVAFAYQKYNEALAESVAVNARLEKATLNLANVGTDIFIKNLERSYVESNNVISRQIEGITRNQKSLLASTKIFNDEVINLSKKTTESLESNVKDIRKNVEGLKDGINLLDNEIKGFSFGTSPLESAFAKIRKAREDANAALQGEDAKGLVKAQELERKGLKELAAIAKGSVEAVEIVQNRTAKALEQQQKDLETLKSNLHKNEVERRNELLRLENELQGKKILLDTPVTKITGAETGEQARLAQENRERGLSLLVLAEKDKDIQLTIIDQINKERLAAADVEHKERLKNLREEATENKTRLEAAVKTLKDSNKQIFEDIKKNNLAIERANTLNANTRAKQASGLNFFFGADEDLKNIIDLTGRNRAALDTNNITLKNRLEQNKALGKELAEQLGTQKEQTKEIEKQNKLTDPLTQARPGDLFNPEIRPAFESDFKSAVAKAQAVNANILKEAGITPTASQVSLDDIVPEVDLNLKKSSTGALAVTIENPVTGGGLPDVPGTAGDKTGTEVGLLPSIEDVIKEEREATTLRNKVVQDELDAKNKALGESFKTAANNAAQLALSFSDLFAAMQGGQSKGARLGGILSAIGGVLTAVGTATGNPFIGGAGVIIGATGQIATKNFANGGEVGTDTVPAMLTPGEFVMNRQSTDRNYAQLKAINGFKYHADGGRISNTTTNVGDINLNINGGSSTARDATGLVSEISRLIRNGRANALA